MIMQRALHRGNSGFLPNFALMQLQNYAAGQWIANRFQRPVNFRKGLCLPCRTR